ncbi:type II secretion system F family protein [Halomarina litorea]|uniref:type II secretion system F family protein n=1 Tax=Halomarina litorea TaxID=2961595 RepID=UPI0020C22BBA|nr:type II secretion system F family protein [Halomarina sp. BCD28]
MADAEGAGGALDRGLYALFSRHADHHRHDRDRRRYRGAGVGPSFDVFLARVYGLSWVGFLLATVGAAVLALAVPAAVLDTASDVLQRAIPVLNRLTVPDVSRTTAAVVLAGGAGIAAKRGVVWGGGQYLRWVASARRASIERTLPGAVRYLRALGAGSDGHRAMLRKVAEQDAYGETARAFQTALNRAALTGSLDSGLRMVARDTPSRDLLSPFLLKFREHAAQGEDALAGYLSLESRMLSHRQARTRQRAADFLELLAELFIVMLVLPALLVIILTVMAVLAPGLSAPVATPLGETTVRALVVYASAGFVLLVGAGAAWLVGALRPPDQAPPTYSAARSLGGVLEEVTTNPASAATVCLPLAFLVAAGCWSLSYRVANVALFSYVAFALPVGVVAVRRARRDDAKDREMKDVVHAVAGHVSLGRPFAEAVERVAREVDSGALQADVDALAFNLTLVTHDGEDVRTAALDRFVEEVGTPLAAQTMGLVTGALDVGSDAEDVFETLQTEVGRLYHERKALRSSLMVYVAVGWTTALLVVGIMVAVNLYVLDGFAQLSTVASTNAGTALDPDAVDPERDRFRFYLVTQATMLACGWFAGSASRGRYEALLHSALLVTVGYAVFAGAGLL